MKNINVEEYIKDLSPELQEKARACKDTDELLKLAEENKLPLPDEALEAVAGGKGGKPEDICPAGDGKSSHHMVPQYGFTALGGYTVYVYKCDWCGFVYRSTVEL